ncbi:DUF6928 family protein [Actinoplanes awajinensis]|uniref:Uncharacterized protein n=1 Tax=Actinoplanes awajinensis subsp. mycoplanecinus TaxID=135947 RepID=A0A101JN49_9ACTN|nr:hypothetical protein [Actinoplanes awajinensis]KUL29583.1 hypothetical protein ADL15_27060 [Actinoplanes awajinensis subsp. mycoplanecinus]
MGAKSALLAFADGDLRPALRAATRSDQAESEALVRKTFPGYDVKPAGDSTLDVTYPPDGITQVTLLPGAALLCDRRLVLDRPSELPAHLLQLGTGRRFVMHGMHSVVDWLCFAVWENGTLVRSLSLSPDGGIAENIGEPYAFERPYWAGHHPVEPDAEWEDEEPYPLPFHPLDLGEEALQALFGFAIEGFPEPDSVDPTSVEMHTFRVGDEPAASGWSARRSSSSGRIGT